MRFVPPFQLTASSLADDEQEMVVHRECRECGQNLAAENDECPRCGGTPVVYEIQ